MLYTNFCVNWSTGSGEVDFLKGSTIYGRSGHFGNVSSIMFPCTIKLG